MKKLTKAEIDSINKIVAVQINSPEDAIRYLQELEEDSRKFWESYKEKEEKAKEQPE